jgi:hypothetical protein
MLQLPLHMSIDTAWAIVKETVNGERIPYVFVGAADVVATQAFRIEKSGYAIDQRGWFSRRQLMDTLGGVLGRR